MRNLNLRLPDDLLTRLREAAQQERRSLNSEILHRLERSLPSCETDTDPPILPHG